MAQFLGKEEITAFDHMNLQNTDVYSRSGQKKVKQFQNQLVKLTLNQQF